MMKTQTYTLSRSQQFLNRLAYRWHSFLNLFPRLVWPGQEVEVGVTFTEPSLDPDGDALAQLREGVLPDIERKLDDIGIEFDTGLGREGRDWEWDYSLRGPIKVTFRRVRKREQG